MPYDSDMFDFAVMIAILCFLDNIPKVFQETRGVLKSDGGFIISLIDRESPLGQINQENKKENSFYREAYFHSVSEVTKWMKMAGFGRFGYWQTLLTAFEKDPEIPGEGYGQGGFVVIKATFSET